MGYLNSYQDRPLRLPRLSQKQRLTQEDKAIVAECPLKFVSKKNGQLNFCCPNCVTHQNMSKIDKHKWEDTLLECQYCNYPYNAKIKNF